MNSVRLIIGVICSTVLYSGSVSVAALPKHNDNALRGLPVPDEAYLSAAKSLLSCTDQKPLPKICQGTWKGLKWLLSTKDWTAQIDLPSGIRWMESCHRDMIEQLDVCSWVTGDEFVVTRLDGDSTIIGWGLRRFPGSAMEARFDDAAPFRTSENSWSAQQSAKIYRGMIRGRKLHYRWYSWPEEQERGGSLDLANFSDAAALMEALRDEFTTSRVLSKIETEH